MDNIFTFSPTNISAGLILFNLIFAFSISFFIAFVHKKTHSGISYSKSLGSTLVLVGPITMVAIMIVQNNIFGALGLLAAFALIRFRTIVKETRDVAFIFFSLVEGVAIGSGHYSTALLSAILISVAAIVLYRFDFGKLLYEKRILILKLDHTPQENKIDSIAKSSNITLLLLNSKKIGSEYEYTYSVKAKSGDKIHTFLSNLENTIQIKNYDLITGVDMAE